MTRNSSSWTSPPPASTPRSASAFAISSPSFPASASSSSPPISSLTSRRSPRTSPSFLTAASFHTLPPNPSSLPSAAKSGKSSYPAPICPHSSSAISSAASPIAATVCTHVWLLTPPRFPMHCLSNPPSRMPTSPRSLRGAPRKREQQHERGTCGAGCRQGRFPRTRPPLQFPFYLGPCAVLRLHGHHWQADIARRRFPRSLQLGVDWRSARRRGQHLYFTRRILLRQKHAAARHRDARWPDSRGHSDFPLHLYPRQVRQ